MAVSAPLDGRDSFGTTSPVSSPLQRHALQGRQRERPSRPKLLSVVPLEPDVALDLCTSEMTPVRFLRGTCI